MRFLYVNLRNAKSVVGHRFFDVQWAKILSKLGKVDLVAPSESWYLSVPSNIHLCICEAQQREIERGIWKLPIWENCIMRHLNLEAHIETYKVLQYVTYLNNINHYDAIIMSTFDIVTFGMKFRKLKYLDKIYLIEHMPSVYQKNNRWRWVYGLFKNKIHHIVMEMDGELYLQKEYQIVPNRVHYIPHPMNHVSISNIVEKNKFQVVGISNSNDRGQIQALIQSEEESGFFKNNKIRAIFRTIDLEYDNGWLKVVSGHVNMEFEQYYNYIMQAQLLVLPFPHDFGIRTSGTVIDGLSNKKILLGSDFATMRQYKRVYPNVCHIYTSLEDMQMKIKTLLSENITDEKEFESFYEERRDEEIQQKVLNMIFGK